MAAVLLPTSQMRPAQPLAAPAAIILAGALVQDAPVVLLDESAAHLDLPNQVAFVRLLHRLACQIDKAVLVSTHELDSRQRLRSRGWLLMRPPALSPCTRPPARPCNWWAMAPPLSGRAGRWRAKASCPPTGPAGLRVTVPPGSHEPGSGPATSGPRYSKRATARCARTWRIKPLTSNH